ncbi:MAG: flagellar export protein FliJ [Armatimonadota bacterium]|nr:flagellar export protein FliJ [Armatimonadota bacterium]
MRKFQFNLQRLLDYRHMIEDTLLAELASIRAEYGRERTRLLDMIRDRDAFSRRMKEGPQSEDAEQMRRACDYLEDLSGQISVQETALRRITERKDKKTAEVVEASRNRKALDRLREVKQSEHGNQAARADQAFLDELASIRSNHQRCQIGERA